MTDTASSGDPAPPAAPSAAPAAPAETAAPPSAPAAQAFGSFGASRGSGLARGKRSSASAAPSAAHAPSGGYHPTAVEVITPPREYENPFGGATSTPAAVSESATEAQVQPASAEAEPTAPSTPFPADTAPAAGPEPKAEINVLPPAEPKRVATSWENTAPGAGAPVTPAERPYRGERRGDGREDRPYFRPEGREAGRHESGFRPRGEGREGRRDAHRHERPRGFIGWLKSLFGGPKPEAADAGERSERPGSFESEREEHSGHRRRRRHRGGRGRHGDYREGDRNREGFAGAPAGEGSGEPRSENRDESRGEPGGNRRRRHRGGRGRHRGDRGPRPEGHQGGGMI